MVWRSPDGCARATGIQVFGRRGGSASWDSPVWAWQDPSGPREADERPPGSLGMSRGQSATARAEMRAGTHDIYGVDVWVPLILYTLYRQKAREGTC